MDYRPPVLKHLHDASGKFPVIKLWNIEYVQRSLHDPYLVTEGENNLEKRVRVEEAGPLQLWRPAVAASQNSIKNVSMLDPPNSRGMMLILQQESHPQPGFSPRS